MTASERCCPCAYAPAYSPNCLAINEDFSIQQPSSFDLLMEPEIRFSFPINHGPDPPIREDLHSCQVALAETRKS